MIFEEEESWLEDLKNENLSCLEIMKSAFGKKIEDLVASVKNHDKFGLEVIEKLYWQKVEDVYVRTPAKNNLIKPFKKLWNLTIHKWKVVRDAQIREEILVQAGINRRLLSQIAEPLEKSKGLYLSTLAYSSGFCERCQSLDEELYWIQKSLTGEGAFDTIKWLTSNAEMIDYRAGRV